MYGITFTLITIFIIPFFSSANYFCEGFHPHRIWGTSLVTTAPEATIAPLPI